MILAGLLATSMLNERIKSVKLSLIVIPET